MLTRLPVWHRDLSPIAVLSNDRLSGTCANDWHILGVAMIAYRSSQIKKKYYKVFRIAWTFWRIISPAASMSMVSGSVILLARNASPPPRIRRFLILVPMIDIADRLALQA